VESDAGDVARETTRADPNLVEVGVLVLELGLHPVVLAAVATEMMNAADRAQVERDSSVPALAVALLACHGYAASWS
jgi:hypothetical protein